MYRLGVDIGGTFTDFVLLEHATGVATLHKQLTTPDDPSEAVIEGIDYLLKETGVDISAVSSVVHGTTLVTNALIERRGSPTGMLVTKGMRDVLDIAKERRYDLFDLRLRFPEPVVPRYCRREINERVCSDGKVAAPLDRDEVRAAIDELIVKEKIEALAVCFLNSYANTDHERQVEELIQSEYPKLKVSCSATVFPYIREYERWTTAVMNAYVQPTVDRYIRRIEERLTTAGFHGKIHIMTSSGGMVTTEISRRFPIRLLESGPAAGSLMAAQVGRELGEKRVLSFDMGGTTAKGVLVRDGKPLKKYELEVARVHEFKAGSGLPAKAPAVDMIEIGAGGGSIASLDDRGLIGVGPTSAGAFPGPACYGRGGQQPTLTDANLILGYLSADSFLGGKMPLNFMEAKQAMEDVICTPLGLDHLRAAWGVHETINEDVARAFRVHASERAFDYRRSSMVGFGGSGPIHAARIARKLNVPTLIVPPGAGVMSAFGLLVSPFSFETAISRRVAMESLDKRSYDEIFTPLVEQVKAVLASAGVDRGAIQIHKTVDVRYSGQGYEVEVPASESLDTLAETFRSAYQELFSSVLLDEQLEIVNWKVEGSGPPPLSAAKIRLLAPNHEAGDIVVGRRGAYVPEQEAMVDVPVYDRYQLTPGFEFSGPAIVEEHESTLIVGDGDLVRVDERLNLIVTVKLGGTA